MKKVLLLGNLGWMLVTMLFLTKCNNSSTTPGISCLDCSNDNSTGLPVDDFLKGIARYRKYQWNSANAAISVESPNGPAFQDARSCWYSLDTLKKFICLIEKNFPGVDPSTSELGIRFYYATYPDTTHYTMQVKLNNNPDQVNVRSVEVNVGLHHTLFMVPTMHNEDQNIDLFQPMDQKKEIRHLEKEELKKLMYPDWNIYMKQNTKLLVLGSVFSTDPSSKNQGMLCPPTCPTDPGSMLGKADAIYPDAVINRK